ISKDVADTIVSHPQARALLLERHGTITWGATVREAYEATIELIARAEDAIAERTRGRRVFGGSRLPGHGPSERRRPAPALAPKLRGLLSRPRRMIVTFDDSPEVTEFVSSVTAPTVSQVGPATPDHTIYTRRLPCYVDVAAEADAAALSRAVERDLESFA